MFNQIQWNVFRLTQQEGKNKGQTAEELGITYKEVQVMLDYMREDAPELFFIDSEKDQIREDLSSKERTRANADIVSFEARIDESDDVHDEIRDRTLQRLPYNDFTDTDA